MIYINDCKSVSLSLKHNWKPCLSLRENLRLYSLISDFHGEIVKVDLQSMLKWRRRDDQENQRSKFVSDYFLERQLWTCIRRWRKGLCGERVRLWRCSRKEAVDALSPETQRKKHMTFSAIYISSLLILTIQLIVNKLYGDTWDCGWKQSHLGSVGLKT